MDTSKEYIKMCEKADEIQIIRHADDCVDRNEWWKSGDFIFNKDGNYVFNVCGVRHCAADTGYFSDKESIWLPRQDQLQEMCENSLYPYLLLESFSNAILSGNTEIRAAFNSMEQLWLAFVMKEKYNKAWNGSDWINSTAEHLDNIEFDGINHTIDMDNLWLI